MLQGYVITLRGMVIFNRVSSVLHQLRNLLMMVWSNDDNLVLEINLDGNTYWR